MTDPWGVYVHVPWCRHRCPYCAFVVDTRSDPPFDAFVERVRTEYAARRAALLPADAGAPHTVFLGGGTPSRLPGPALARLLDGLAPRAGAEVTAEANPEDVTPPWLDAALEAGVNRLSLGVQSFDDRVARRLGRGHTAPQARRVTHLLRDAGLRSWSVDLIFAVPGQSLDDLRADLAAVLDTGTPHVALYGLTFEEGTPFERLRARGALRPTEDDTWRAMYEVAVDTLEAASLHRYEVSNFARAGHTSAHNRLYWTDRPYLGLGPAAHGYAPDGTRWVNVAEVSAYLAADDPTAEHDRPSPRDAAVDLLIASLRGVDGVDLAHLERRTGHRISAAALRPLVEAGLVQHAAERLMLTRDGFPLTDAVLRHLVAHVAAAPSPD